MQVTRSPEPAGGIARRPYAPVGDARDAVPKPARSRQRGIPTSLSIRRATARFCLS